MRPGVGKNGGGDGSICQCSEPAQSQTVSVVLLVGFVVSFTGMGYAVFAGIDVSDPSNTIHNFELDAHVEGNIEFDRASSNDIPIVLRHGSNKEIRVSDTEIVVDTPEHQARLVNLPLNDCPTSTVMKNQHTEGDEVFRAGCSWGGVLIETTTDTWKMDNELMLRMKDDLPSLDRPSDYTGETVTVTVIDASEGEVLTEVEIGID